MLSYQLRYTFRLSIKYSKFGNFREDFIFTKLRIFFAKVLFSRNFAFRGNKILAKSCQKFPNLQ